MRSCSLGQSWVWVTNGLLPAIAYSRALMCSYKQVWGLTRGRARTRLWRERHLEYKGVVASWNCASQRSPKISIVLELHLADREYVERWWKEAIAYNSAMAFADQQRAGYCGRYRHSCDKGAVLEGFPQEGRVRPAVTVLAGSHTAHGPAGKGKKLLLEETSSRKCFTCIGTFGLGLERWVAFLFPSLLVVIYPN